LVATGFIWQLMLNPQLGIINPLLGQLHLGFLEKNWLGDPNLSIYVVALVQAWTWLGLPMVVYLAGLQMIPEELMEAARIDGASPWKRLRHVTLPLLAAPFTILSVFCFITMYRVFDIVYVLEGQSGPPDQTTTTLATVMYVDAFGGLGVVAQQTPQMGYALAIGVLSFLVLGAVAGIIYVVLRRRELEMA
jgi:raffinose/stachyose/melibiose transport system permease protein